MKIGIECDAKFVDFIDVSFISLMFYLPGFFLPVPRINGVISNRAKIQTANFQMQFRLRFYP